MNVMPIRLFTIQDGEGFVADVFQCPVTKNLIYKSSGTPAIVSYEQLSEIQKRELQRYGFQLLTEKELLASNQIHGEDSHIIEEFLPKH
ncbi:hypothetical protein PNH38_15765 [Anoxybacillus rupiensis]|jgi:hypothetical protein|uniref:Uncharacterized protein n=1 Tax=Anoxybacteroides rupiense TaxID=311460 RepID=A0ABT5W7K9_9BACL|nr:MULTISPECIES: hypothetical protein [Anoxybacillus]MBB3909189.1 hypothetical protein [Anoxybacillus rupiensis]MBS2772820.1 hypothetical protein [Anoxybacillus rupiensis]MDE8565311.1 hypothetical protein [Anoxybacillus rupiensis]QHC05178.1 hypothetical protein GRQ40_15325 [Anoxybacillus sp. PDR2]